MKRRLFENLGLMLLLMVVAVFCPTLAQQQTGQKPAKGTGGAKPSQSNTHAVETLDQKLENLILLARGASPEIRADALLILENSKLVTSATKKKELLQQAFSTASEVREPVRRKSWSRVVDTHSGYMQYAYDLELDRLSLQSKVVISMASLNPARAREMFEQISLQVFKRLSCEDSLVYNVDRYYEAAQVVFDRSFSLEEKQAGVDVQFLSDRIDAVTSIAQAIGVIQILLKPSLSGDSLVRLVQGFAQALSKIVSDPRAFAYAVSRDGFVNRLNRLFVELRNREIPTTDLVQAGEKFLKSNLMGDVCADLEWFDVGEPELPWGIEAINLEFQAPITVEDLGAARKLKRASDVVYWSTQKGNELLTLAKSLRFGGGRTPLTLEERQTEGWRQKLVSFLESLEGWKAEAEATEEDYFFQRCNMYLVLVDVCPDDVLRDVVMRSYSAYLKEASNRYKGRIEWVFQVKEYLRALRNKSDNMRQASLDPWLNSSDNSLRIYGQLTQMTSSKN